MIVSNPTKWYTILVFVAFLFYSLYELFIVLNSKSLSALKQEAKQTLFYIVGIATVAYSFIAYQFGVSQKETFATRSVRYLDWIITTPLITYSYYLIGRLNGVEVNLASLLVSNLLFVGLGVVSEYIYQKKSNHKKLELWFAVLSFVFFGIYLYNIYQLTRQLHEKQVNTRGLEYFFYIGWTLYGVVFIGEIAGYLEREFVINSYVSSTIPTFLMSPPGGMGYLFPRSTFTHQSEQLLHGSSASS
jgi:bacteriorhodopsin